MSGSKRLQELLGKQGRLVRGGGGGFKNLLPSVELATLSPVKPGKSPEEANAADEII